MRFVNFTKDTFLFQFHEGPIKTLLMPQMVLCKVSFNSMKVRLKLKVVLTPLLLLNCFNSMKVRLKPRKNFATL